MRGTQGVSPLDRCLCFPDGFGQEGVGKEWVISFPHHLQCFLPLFDAVVLGPGLPEPEAWMIPKRETDCALNLTSEFLKA